MGLVNGARDGDSQPTFMGMPAKQVSLITLTFQNSALILLLQYSRIMAPPGDHRYFPSTAVFLCEVIKLAVSLTLAIHDSARRLLPSSSPPLPNTATPAATASSIFTDVQNAVLSKDNWKLAIPAALYTFQNTLQYAAVENLDGVHYQVLYQLKILTTAVFSVILLRRPLPPHRWLALVLLTSGLCVVTLVPDMPPSHTPIVLHDTSDHVFPRSVHELSGISSGAREMTRRAIDAVTSGGGVGIGIGARGSDAAHLAKRSATYQGIADDEYGTSTSNYAVGLTAVLTAATVSGLAGVLLESVLKAKHHAHATAANRQATNSNVWTRNVQLSFYSLLVAAFGIVWRDGADIAVHGFFDGYTWVVWMMVLFHSSEGLVGSLCIKYADNIAKNFATSFSIILSFILNVVFFDSGASLAFVLGTGLVLSAAYVYSLSPAAYNSASLIMSHVNRAPRPSPLRLATKNMRPGTFAPQPGGGSSNASTPQHLTPRLATLKRMPSATMPRTSMPDESGYWGVGADPFDGIRSVGLSTSRPASPMVSRAPLGRKAKD